MTDPFPAHPLPPRPDRRAFLAAAGLAGGIGATSPALATAIAAETFGVRPDGADQTSLLQVALDAATAAGRPLLLEPGDYIVTGLRLPADATLIGPRTARLVQISDVPLVTADGVGAARLSGLTLRGIGAGLGESALLRAVEIAELVVEDVAFEEAPGYAVRLDRCGGRIVGCVVRGATTGVLSLDATGLTVAGNVVEDCLDNGIQIWRSQKGFDGSQVLNNRITRIGARSGGSGQYGNGVNVFRAGDVLVSENVIGECVFSAVRNNAGDGVQILSNQVRDCGEVAIFTEFAFEGAVIASNRLIRVAMGIVSTNLDDGGRLAVISGNLVRDVVRRQPTPDDPTPRSWGIFAEADAAITGNVVERAQDEGIRLGWGPFLRNVACTGNVVRDCPTGLAVSVVEGVGPTLIASNLFIGATSGAIVGARWYEVATGDLVRDASAWEHLTITGNAVG